MSSEKDAASDPLGTWAANHTPLLATLFLFALVVIRVLRVAQFDPATATALVRESGVVSIVVGVLVTSLPQLLIGSAVLLTFLSWGGPGTKAQRTVAWTTVAIFVFLFTILLPWPTLIFVLIVLVIVNLAARRFRPPLQLFAVVGLISFIVLEPTKVWLPPEAISRSHEPPIVGYVLSTDDRWTTVLIESDRSVVVLNSADVVGRQVCNLPELRSRGRTIIQLIGGEQGGLRNPACPAS